MKLRKLGGRYQPIIESPEDIWRILEVDHQHWSANCAPIDGLSCDAQFLKFLDQDQNGKILPVEVCGALNWLRSALKDASLIWEQSDALPLAAFQTETPLGQALRESAEHVLQTLGHSDAVLKLEHVRARTQILQAAEMNGDGVIPPSAVKDEEQKKAVADLVVAMGGLADLNGELGIDLEQLTAFPVQARAWLQWSTQAPPTSFENPKASVAAIEGITSELDAFFKACMLLKGGEKPASQNLMAIPNPEAQLEASAWISPECRESWRQFLGSVPIGPALSWGMWEDFLSEAKAYAQWLAAEPKGGFSKLSAERLAELVENTELHAALKAEIEADKASAKQLEKLADLEKVLLFQINMRAFLSSYVNFSQFYNPKTQSLPERGDLLMDGRLFRLSVKVLDRAKHKARAKDSGFFLLYVEVTDPKGAFEVATAVTGARRGDLHIGKKGVFTAIGGSPLPAEIVDILDNPINIREAFWAPFSSVRGFVQKKFENMASKHQQELEQTVDKGFAPADTANKAAMLNGGVTVAALSSSFAYLIKTLSSIQVTQLLTVTFAPLLVVALLSSLMAWWKLQRRDLGPVLEASGWGINHPLYAPSWATQVFTQAANVPKEQRKKDADLLIGYQASIDPYGRSKRRLVILLWMLLAFLIWYGFDYLQALYEWRDWE